jgi:hypothetical protein
MGIFTDFATSSGGALLQGVLDEADNIARQDAQTNAIVAQNALDKENEAFKKTELAFKHRDELVKTIVANAEEFGIVPGDLTIEQMADRLVGKVFNNQRSIFELPNFASVSNAFARNLAKLPGEEIVLDNPYIASQNLFNQEAEKHSARISAITKMPKADKLLHNIKKAEAKVESPEVLFSKAMTIAPISAKAYGILGFYPDSKEGRDALAFQKTSLIVANARFYHPDDPKARAEFMERKLYENQIDPFAALQFKNPMNFRQISNVLDQMSANTSSEVFRLTTMMNNPELTEEARLEIKGQIDNLTLEQMRQVNNASSIAIMQMAGRNVPVDQSMINTEAPIVDEGATGAQLEQEKTKPKPQRLGGKDRTIKKDEVKQQPKKKESILTPGLKFKNRGEGTELGEMDTLPTAEEKKVTIPNPGSGSLSRGKLKKRRGDKTVKVDEQKQEDIIQQDDMLPDDGTIQPDSISALQADFRLNTVNKNYIINQWSKKYQGDDNDEDRRRVNRDLLFRSVKIPEEAESQIAQVAEVFAGQNNFTEDNIMEMLGAIGFFESKYRTKVQKGKGPARSYWQVEPSTAESILDQNLNVMKDGGNPILGPNFEKLFRSRYAKQIGSGTALEYFASLNRKELSDLLLKDGLFAASMAAHKVVTTFDPFNSKGA